MWQKKLFLCFLISVSCSFAQANAQTVKVTALDTISTVEPASKISVKLDQTLQVTNEQFLSSDVILIGKLTDVKQPSRLKKDAKFSFEAYEYKDLEGQAHKIDPHIVAKYAKPLDKKSLAKNAALSAGGLVVKGFSTEVAAISGAIKNEQGNRLKSSAVSVYENSPLSYFKKGNEIQIEKGQSFFLKFPKIKNDDTQNEKQVK